MITFNLKHSDLLELQSYNKLVTQLLSISDTTYFKVSNGEFKIIFKGRYSLFEYTISDIDYTQNDSYYFSIDYTKWQNALIKYNNCEIITITLDKGLNISNGINADKINLAVKMYDSDSQDVDIIDNFIGKNKEAENKLLNLTDEVVNGLSVVSSILGYDQNINSLGLSNNGIVYADRCTVLSYPINDKKNNIFELLKDDENIFINSLWCKLFMQFEKTNKLVYLNDSYDRIFWSDNNCRLIMSSPECYIALPTQEQFEEIKPSNNCNKFNTSILELKGGMEFFDGFHENNNWKPVKFSLSNNDLRLSIQNNVAELDKRISVNSAVGNGQFTINSDVFIKLCHKLSDVNEDLKIEVNFDDNSVGVYCTTDVCDFVISKINEE